MNNRKYGVSRNTKATALTPILVGLDESGRYIYNRNNMVYEHFQPCPDGCPEGRPNLLNQ